MSQFLLDSRTSPLDELPRAIEDLDVRILRELTSPGSFQWDFRESFSEMGKHLEADPETVRTTLNRSQRLGLIQKWRLVPNPELFGRVIAGIQLAVSHPEKKPDIILQLQKVDGIFLILDFHGPSLKLYFYVEENSLTERKQGIKTICGQDIEIASWVLTLPNCRMEIGKLDWNIIQNLIHEPRKGATKVAEKIGVSSRTVNRRLKAMTEANVAILFPVRNARNRKGTLCSFLIFGSEEALNGLPKILKSLKVPIDFLTQLSQDKTGLIAEVRNPSEAKELSGKLESVEGISQVVTNLVDDYIFVDNWIDQMVAGLAA